MQCVSIGKTLVKGPLPVRTIASVTMAASRWGNSARLGKAALSTQLRSQTGSQAPTSRRARVNQRC